MYRGYAKSYIRIAIFPYHRVTMERRCVVRLYSLCSCMENTAKGEEGEEVGRLCPSCEIALSNTLLNATQFVLDWAKAVPLSVSTAGGTGNVLAHAILVERDNIAKRAEKSSYFLSFSTDGIGGNSNRDIKKFHGWRGTTNDVAIYAYGIRKIQSIKICHNGIPHVKVGCDLHPDWS